MKTKTALISLFMLALCVSCGVSKKKRTYGSKARTVHVPASEEDSVETPEVKPLKSKERITPLVSGIIETALSYSGTRYKYGGTTAKGMDCSGLLFISFKEHGVDLPRVSRQMAEEGKKIRVPQVRTGDLLFFRTATRRGPINHVGLVVDVKGDDIRFIHSTTSRGVIVSSLKEGYWNYAFVKATRILGDAAP